MIEDEIGNQYYGCIYGILISPKITTNRSDFYVGQTINFDKRKRCHWRSGDKSNMPIDAAILKYNNKNFEMFIIEYCNSLEELNEAEEFWVSYYKSIGTKLYNIKGGGNNHRLPPESIERMRLKKIGQKK